MPLHDWNEKRVWQDVHVLWITELYRWLKPRLPAGFRASMAMVGAMVVAPAPVHPDVSVRQELKSQPQQPAESALPLSADLTELTPDEEVALALLEPARAVYVRQGRDLIAAIELISPGNKDRPDSRRRTTDRFLGYLMNGVHLLFVDVHPLPRDFSFADDLDAALGRAVPPLPTPCAVSYGVGDVAPEAVRLATWRRSLAIGQPLPVLPLPLTRDRGIQVDLEQTYMRATADAYL